MRTLFFFVVVAVAVGWPMPKGPRRFAAQHAQRSGRLRGAERWPIVGAVVVAVAALVQSPAVAVVTPLLILGWQRERHRRREQKARVDRVAASLLFVDSVVAKLRAGGSLVAAVTSHAGAGPWGVVNDRAAAGRSLVDTMQEVSGASVASDEQMIAVTIAALDASGAPAGEALERLSDALRARQSAADDARTQAQQALSSSAVLAALPLVFGIAAAVIEPDVGSLYRRSWLGAGCISLATVLVIIGWEWMQRLLQVADG